LFINRGGNSSVIEVMNAFLRAVEFLLITGNYLLFWPLYRLLHPKKSERRRALLNLFLIELTLYGCVTGLLVVAVYNVPDFHHGGFLLVELLYLILAVVFWVATFGVWADNRADTE
jgi:uncharacterized membrane protein